MAEVNRPKLLITGGSGFPASRRGYRPIAQEYEVPRFNDLWAGSAENVRHLPALLDFTSLYHEIPGPLHLRELLAGPIHPAKAQYYQGTADPRLGAGCEPARKPEGGCPYSSGGGEEVLRRTG